MYRVCMRPPRRTVPQGNAESCGYECTVWVWIMGVSDARRGRGKERRKNYLMCLGKKEKREKGKNRDRTGGVKEGGRGGGKGYGYPTRDNSSGFLTRERASRSQKEQRSWVDVEGGGWWRERYRNQDLR